MEKGETFQDCNLSMEMHSRLKFGRGVRTQRLELGLAFLIIGTETKLRRCLPNTKREHNVVSSVQDVILQMEDSHQSNPCFYQWNNLQFVQITYLQ